MVLYKNLSCLKVGIVSQYYNSINYGGNLQAYALCYVVNDLGCSAEQICYKYTPKKRINKIFNLKKVIGYITKNLNAKKYKFQYVKSYSGKKEAFFEFSKNIIKHSKNVYERKDISRILGNYDCFIVGSDQVWNTNNYDEVYRLDFVTNEKYKFSYAAGVSNKKFTVRQKNIFKNTLNSYNAVSVREKKAVSLLQPLTDKTVEWVLDPTLLLNNSEWNIVCSERKIKEEYIFCYFLGGLNLKNSDIIEFAVKKRLKIVTFPFLCGTSLPDGDFGDYRIYDASPQDFISYIKYSEYVFTDSFHATVFSHIYKRNFFVFNRKGFKAMNDRIYSLTDLFDTGDRFCDSKEKCTLEYIESLPPIDYEREFPKFEEMKEKSINFLKDNLKNAEEKLNEDDRI